MSLQETQLNKLIKDGKKIIDTNDMCLEPCKEWIDQEVRRIRKIIEQIERLQKHKTISSALFNESRDLTDELEKFIQKLHDYHHNQNKSSIEIASKQDVRKMFKNASYQVEFKVPI